MKISLLAKDRATDRFDCRSLLSEVRKIRILPVVRDTGDFVAKTIAHHRSSSFNRCTGAHTQKSDHTPPDQK